MWARQLGAREVVVSDPVASRRALAETMGASATVDPTKDDVVGEFERITRHQPGVVIECVGVPGMIQHAVDVAAIDATVVIAGVCMAPDSLMPITPMTKELEIRFAFYYRARDYDTAISMIDRERIDPLPLVTAEVGLDELPQRFQQLKAPTDDCKVMIRP
jgi:(R,R)-butanediol dehydrogenase/meso-butanediol dehydrogenase/diacetyl reductase